MVVIVNDASIVEQFTYEEFVEYIRTVLVPILNQLSRNDVDVYKDYETWTKMPVEGKTLATILNCKGNPVITSFAMTLHKVFLNEPYWRDSISSLAEAHYISDIGEGINCITEASARNGGLLSFKDGGFNSNSILLKENDLEKEVPNFFDVKSFERFEDVYITKCWEKNSFYVDLPRRCFLFEVRFDEENHARPHFHMTHNEESYSISIPDADVLASSGKQINVNDVRCWAIRYMDKIERLWNDVHGMEKKE